MDTYKKNQMKSRISWIFATILALAWTLVAILPFIFMVLNSFKEKFEMMTKGVFNLPDKFYLDNFLFLSQTTFS